jgi:hypothetical protein
MKYAVWVTLEDTEIHYHVVKIEDKYSAAAWLPLNVPPDAETIEADTNGQALDLFIECYRGPGEEVSLQTHCDVCFVQRIRGMIEQQGLESVAVRLARLIQGELKRDETSPKCIVCGKNIKLIPV